MGRRNILMLIGATVFAALVTLLVAGQINKAKRAGQDDVVNVAVAKVDLKWGTVLTKEMLDKSKFLKTSLPARAITDPSPLPGRVVIVPITANAPILESNLAPTTLKTGGVSAIVSPDKRAIAVKVDKAIGVGGFIRQGNRVDVLVTVKRLEGYTYNPITKTVLENILVLAVGPDIEEKKGKEEKANIVEVITIEVTPDEAEKVSLAAQEGKISMVLRSYADTKEILTPGHNLSSLLASYSSGSHHTNGQASRPTPQSASKFSLAKQSSTPPTKGVKKGEEKKEEKPKYTTVELVKGVKTTEVKIAEPSL